MALRHKTVSRVFLFSFLFFFVVFLCDLPAYGGEMPVKWPWRGVSIDFPGGSLADLERYKSELPINMVRLHINVRTYAIRNNLEKKEALEGAFLWTESMLDACARLGLGATIEMSQFPLDPGDPQKISLPSFWKNDKYLDEIVWLAGRLSERFKGRGMELLSYQILSEPVVYRFRHASVPARWEDLLKRIVSEIRTHDKQRWIVVAPGPGGNPGGYDYFNPPDDRRLIWGVHMYLPHDFTHQGIRGRPLGVSYPGRVRFAGALWNKRQLRSALKPLRLFEEEHPGPVYVGEFSAVRWGNGSEEYIRDLVDIFDEYGWGWSYFSATSWHGWNPDYNTEFSDDKASNWKPDYQGRSSVRWKTLEAIFGIDAEGYIAPQ